VTTLQKQIAVLRDIFDVDPDDAIHALTAAIGAETLIKMAIYNLQDIGDAWTAETIERLYDDLACGDETQEQINDYEGRWLDRQRL
tara:strand:+ start:81 stop:338 length:258 start_codon:yes stop_codon:yes gene_type:complete